MAFTRRTTFILGAGASKEFDLPLGYELKDRVRTRLASFQVNEHFDGDDPMVVAMNNLDGSRKQIIEAAEKARAAIPMFASIDDFLLQFKDNPLVAEVCRLAISESILVAEQRSHLHFCLSKNADDRGTAHDYAARTWIGKLLRRIAFKADGPEDAVSNLSFIVFNYDRCLEAYLVAGLRDAFGISQEYAAQVAASVPTSHVYGSMGPLPEFPKAERPVAFGDNSADLTEAARAIRTYGEGLGDEQHAASLAGIIAASEQVVSLGYAFHSQGIELLFPHGPIPGQQLHATVLGLGSHANAVRGLAGDLGWILEGGATDLLDRLDKLTS